MDEMRAASKRGKHISLPISTSGRYILRLPARWFLASIAMLPFEGVPIIQKLVNKKELKIVYGIPYSFAHIARLEAAGLFPKRVQLRARRVAWGATKYSRG